MNKSEQKHLLDEEDNDSKLKEYTKSNDSQNSLVFVVIGTTLLWFGWFGFNGGSAVSAERNAILALVNTNVCPSVSLLTWLVLDLIFKGRPTVTGMCIGVVAGLVGITPCAGFVRVWAGAVVGVGSAVIPYFFSYFRDRYKLFDDRLDVFGCHGLAGIWGGFCLGFFLCDIRYDNTCDPNTIGVVYGNPIQLVYQLIGITTTIAYSFSVSALIMIILKSMMRITVHKEAEKAGLDKEEFQEIALYQPDANKRKILLIKNTLIKRSKSSYRPTPVANKRNSILEKVEIYPNENKVDAVSLNSQRVMNDDVQPQENNNHIYINNLNTGNNNANNHVKFGSNVTERDNLV